MSVTENHLSHESEDDIFIIFLYIKRQQRERKIKLLNKPVDSTKGRRHRRLVSRLRTDTTAALPYKTEKKTKILLHFCNVAMTESTFHATHADTETCHNCKQGSKQYHKKRKIHHLFSGQNAEKVFPTHDSYKSSNTYIHIK